jgi:hypothetical protein
MAGPFASSTLQFIADFRGLHEKLRKGVLSPIERTRYGSLRQQFIRMMTISQIGVTGQTLRSDLRMSKMLKVEIRPADAPVERVTTLDIATKGFATLMPTALAIGTVCDFTLFLPKPASPIKGRVVVASARKQGTLVRTSFTFENLLPEATEQLDITLVDAVLERFTTI